MSERYSILYSLPERLYAEGAPVLIAAGNLLKDNETEKVVVQLKLQNIGAKTIKALRVRLTPFDTVGKPLGDQMGHQYLDLTAHRDDSFGQKTVISLPDAATRSFAAEVTEVAFTDNTLWTASGVAWEPLPAGESLWSWLGDGELVKQYELQYGEVCEYRSQQVKDLWLCACGTVNHSVESKCHQCGNTLSGLLAVDLEKLKADRDARLVEERQERERQKAEAQVRTKKVKKTAVIIGSLGTVAAAFLIVLFTVILPATRYKNAIAAADAGEYDRAIEMFTALGDYKDSAEQVKAAETAKAEAEEAARQAELAAEEAARQAALEAEKQTEYQAAEELLSQGNKGAAAIAFAKMGDYSDAQERSLALWDEIAVRETVSAGIGHTVGLRSDGTVVYTGNKSDNCEVSDWTNIIAVSAGTWHTVGLRADGTVIAVGKNDSGQCDVSSWSNIVAVTAGQSQTVGLRSNGTVVAVGDDLYGQCDVSGWTDIVAVSTGVYHTVGLRSDGTAVATGAYFNGQCDVSGWTDIVAVSAGWNQTIGLHSDGTTVATGVEDDGKCNVSDWTDVVAVYASTYHTVGLRSDGTVAAVGKKDDGQCDVAEWTDIVSISAGSYCTVGLRSDGTVVAVGNNSQDQCDVSGWTNIKLPNN